MMQGSVDRGTGMQRRGPEGFDDDSDGRGFGHQRGPGGQQGWGGQQGGQLGQPNAQQAPGGLQY